MFKCRWLLLLTLLFGVVLVTACGNSSNTQESSGPHVDQEQANDESALPDEYPDQVIDMLVGFGAGGGTDISARQAIEAMNANGIVDQSFVVENMPGAGGSIALRELSTRKGDIYSLIAIPEYGSGLWNYNVGEGVSIDDFTPIAQIATDYQVIAVREDSPIETIDELLNVLKEDPSSITISIASSLDGGEPWRWHEIKTKMDIEEDLSFMTTEGGNASLTALLSGDSDVAFVVPSLFKDHEESGSIRGLAVLTDERTEELDHLPTLKEAGVDVTYYRPRGFWAAGDIPEVVANYWEDAFKQVMETEEWKQYVDESGLLLEFADKKEYTEYIKNEGESYQDYYDMLQE